MVNGRNSYTFLDYLTSTNFSKSALPQYSIHSEGVLRDRLRLQPLPLQVPVEVHGPLEFGEGTPCQEALDASYAFAEYVLRTTWNCIKTN